MKAYIHQIATSEDQQIDFKQIVPNPLMRRRMSRIVRDGVSAASLCCQGHDVDAILTATGYGCLTDSEKFLHNIIDTDEQLLSPTSFIQSTFNTIGATIALLQQKQCYNMTYTHGSSSLEAALLDGLMMLEDNEAKSVLVGAIEEMPDSMKTLLQRLRVSDIPSTGGACFFRLNLQAEGAKASIEIQTKLHEAKKIKRQYSDPLSMARRIEQGVSNKECITLDNIYTTIHIKCLQ